MRLPHIALLLSASLRLPAVLGWGAAGHEIVATIAQIHLHPTVFPVLCDILNFTNPDTTQPLCHLAPIATWADRVRYSMRWSAPLHYVGAVDDHPSQTCAFPGPGGWAGTKQHNVLGATRNVTNIVDDYVTSASVPHSTANEALKFLVHFLGDLHMPLHLTGRERGGNSVKVKFGGRVTNLHSVWDSLLIAKAIRETPRNYTRPLPYPQIEHALRGTIYDSYVRRIMWEGVLSQWKDELSSWVSCPSPSASSPASSLSSSALLSPTTLFQTVLSTVTRFLGFGSPNPGGETDDHLLCPYHWAQPIHALNCALIWPPELDEPPYRNASRINVSQTPSHAEDESHSHDEEDRTSDELASHGPLLQLDTPEYAGVIAERLIIEKLLAQAGIRLAATLNWLFANHGQASTPPSELELKLRLRELQA